MNKKTYRSFMASTSPDQKTVPAESVYVTRWTGIFLLCLFALGMFLRLYQTTQRGPSSYDEGMYLLYAQTFARIPSMALSFAREFPKNADEGRAFIRERFPEGFFPAVAARPGYILPLALFMFFDDGSGIAALFFSALMGCLAILAAYLLAFEVSRSRFAALIAASLVSISPYHVMYSRFVFPHVTTSLVLTLGLWAYCRSFRAERQKVFRWIFFSGLMAGFAFSTHINVTPVLAAWVLFECIVAFFSYRGDLWARLGVFGAGIAIPLLFWHSILFIKGLAMGAYASNGQNIGYLGEYMGLMKVVSRLPFSLSDTGYYLGMLQFLNGSFFIWLFAVSCVSVMFFKRARNIPHVFIFSIALFFLCFYSVSALRATRTLAGIMPAITVCTVIGIYYILSLLKIGALRMSLWIAMVGIMCATQLGVLGTILNLKSGYKEATAAFLELPGNDVRVGTPWILFQWYAKRRVFSSFDKPLASGEGRYFIVDGASIATSPEEEAYTRSHAPLAEYPNPVLQFYPFLRDLFFEKWPTERVYKELLPDPRVGTIRIYKL